MKKILLVISIFNFVLLAAYLFAHFVHLGINLNSPPIPGNAPDPGSDPEILSINDDEWFLAAIGLVYVFYKSKALSSQK